MFLFVLDHKAVRFMEGVPKSATKSSRKRRSFCLPSNEDFASDQLFLMNQLQQRLLEAALGKQNEVSASLLLSHVFPPFATEGSCSSQENIDPSEQPQDTGLTNLTWLSDLRAKDLTPFAKTPSEEEASSEEEGEDYNVVDVTLSKEQIARLNPSLRRNLIELTMYYKNTCPNFLLSANKPPYSYSTLILLALVSHPKKCVPLCDIYTWIKANFKFFAGADQSWQNSIRHNLSLNPLFVKVSKPHDDFRKGHCWEVSQQYKDIVQDHIQNFSQLGDIRIVSQVKQKPARVKKRNGTTTSSNKKKTTGKKKGSRSGDPMCSVMEPLRVEDLDWMNLLGHSKQATSHPCGNTSHIHTVGASPLAPGMFLQSDPEPNTSTCMSPIASVNLGINDSTPAKEFDFLRQQTRCEDSPVQLLFGESTLHNPSDPKSILERPHPWAEDKEDTLQYLKDFQQTIQTLQ